MDEIFGQDSNWEENPVSIADRRRSGELRASKYIHYRDTTTATRTLSTRAQRAAGGAVENEQNVWQVQAMEYFNGRLDEINESMVGAFSGVFAELSRINSKVDALAESVAERSEAVKVKPVLNVTLDASQFEDSMGVAQELTAELEKRVERIAKRRAGSLNTHPPR